MDNIQKILKAIEESETAKISFPFGKTIDDMIKFRSALKIAVEVLQHYSDRKYNSKEYGDDSIQFEGENALTQIAEVLK